MTDTCSVLHLIRPRPAGEVGGADLHIADLAEAQASRGAEVAVVSIGNPEFAALLRDRGIESIEIASENMRTWYRLASRAVTQRRPEIIHSHGYRADMMAATLRWHRYHGRPGHRPGFVMSLHGFVRTGVGLRLLTHLNELCLRAADVIVATSTRETDRLARRGHPTVFIPNGVRPAPRAPHGYLSSQLGLDGRRRVAFVGRLSPEKRPDLFLHMARRLAADHPDLVFVLIGGGPLTWPMRRLADELGLARRVAFTGLRRDVGELLYGVDVLVCPSDTEGTPRAVVEAMTTSVPVVATNVGGLPDLITDGVTGVIVEPGSARLLADAVQRLIADPARARTIAKAGAACAQSRFSLEQMERQVASAYADARRHTEVTK